MKGEATPPVPAGSHTSHRRLLLLLLVLMVVAIIFCWPLWEKAEKRRRANRAIDMAFEACARGSDAELPQQLAVAELAIRGLDPDDWATYSTKLDNQLILLGCKVGQVGLHEKREWTFAESVSPMDGTKTQSLRLEAVDSELPAYASGTLMIRCKAGKSDLYVVTGRPAAVEYGLDTNTVRIRLDDRKPLTQHWWESDDHEALFAPDPVPLAQQIAEAHTMLFEFTPFQETKKLIRFDLEDLKRQVEKVAVPCGWAEQGAAREKDRSPGAEVHSWPSGATVLVDGQDVGLTPLRVPLTPGSHRITITKSGYEWWDALVTIEPDRTEHVEVTLEEKK